MPELLLARVLLDLITIALPVLHRDRSEIIKFMRRAQHD